MSTDAQPLILIVEDDAGAATLQRRRLERSGFRVAHAGTVDAAIEMLAAGGVSLVVMDYRLGGTTGLDLHRQMRASGHDVPVIMVTGSSDDDVVVQAMRAGIRDFVVKTEDYLDYLPAAARGIIAQAAAIPGRQGAEAHATHVLVVEDDEQTATLERRRLERSGYRVTVAATAEEALAAVREDDVDLVLLDLKLPDGVTGLELYERMKREGCLAPAILVTGFADEATAIEALRAGIRDFVAKSPDFLDYLPTAVDRVVAQLRVEQKLVDSELRLASIVGTTMDAIVMCDESFEIGLFNKSAEEMFGRPAALALGTRLDLLMPGLRIGDRPEDRRVELDGVRADGAILPIEVSVSEVVVQSKRLFTVIARDISERRRTEVELREADRRKDEFLGMLAHELRNPLAAITNAGEVLDRTLKDPVAARLVAVVKRQTRALARMVDDLLEVSRVTLGKIRLTKEPLLLSQIVSRATDAMREPIQRAGLRLDVAVAPEPIWLEADGTRLEQVMTNLLSNAVKFTHDGGAIAVRAGREGHEAIIRVRDTGVGMEASILPRVFDLFVQADTSLDRSQSGLGIGLALVQQIVRLHGGEVTAASEGLGKGSEFVVRLPAVRDERAEPAVAAIVPAAGGRRVHVLVVDDQPDMADCVALLIEALGHQARAVYDGATALAVARAEPPDVMFIDIGMPGLSGYDVAREIRSRADLAHVRLVAVTGYGRDEDRARALESGFDLHLTKPVADATLRAVLADLAPA